jgi:hypothetical protein
LLGHIDNPVTGEMIDSDDMMQVRKYDSIISYITIFLAIIPIIFGFFYIHKFGVNIPQWDQWDSLVPVTVDCLEGKFDFSFLIAELNDSRPVFPNIIMLTISIITAMNIKSIFYVGYIFYAMSIIMIAYLILKDLRINGHHKYHVILILPILYYAFNPYYLFRYIYNLGSLGAVMILSALIAVYLLDISKTQNSSKRSYIFFALSILSGMVCTFSFAAGLTIWFAGLLQLFLQKTENKYKKIFSWFFVTISIVYFYYFGLGFKSEGIHGTTGYHDYIITALTYPIQKFLCFMGALGAQVVHDREMALFFGLLMSILFILLILNNKHVLRFDEYSKWYGLLAFGTLTALELALTRSGPDAIFFIPAIRHSLVIFLPLICIYCLALLYTKASMEDEPISKKNNITHLPFGRRELNILLLGMILTLLICGALLHVLPGISVADSNRERAISAQYYLLNYETATDDNLKFLHPNPETVRRYAQKMEQYNLGIFSQSEITTELFSNFELRSIEPEAIVDLDGNDLKKGYYIKSSDVRMGSLSMPAIFEHPQGPGSSLTYTNIFIPDEAHFEFYIGMDERIGDKPNSDGVTFEVLIYDPSIGHDEKLFSKSIDPANDPEDRHWHYNSINLEKYAGHWVSITLVTLPNSNNNYNWAWWGNPRFRTD